MPKGKRQKWRKKIINNVRSFFEKEKCQGKATLQSRVIDRTAEATGVGRATVIRIKREMNEKEKFESPEKKSRALINVDDFDCGVIN